MPGTDPADAAAVVFGELADFPYLPELPARGPGAELIGRGSGLLVDLPVELVPSGWRLTAHPGRDERRTRDLLAWDLDALQGQADGYTGPLKVQAAGPWTLAAGLELPNGHKLLSDAGAVRDLVASLADGIAAHLAEIATRVPGAQPVLQLDEPSLPAVLAGRIATPSGYGTVGAVEPVVAEDALRAVLAVAADGARVVHCCASDVPIELLHAAGADAIALDAALVGSQAYDALGAAVDTGLGLWLGVVPGTDAPIGLDTARTAVRRLWGELGFAAKSAAEQVVPTPACGLAGASPAYVRRAFSVLRDVGKALLDDAE
jgi:hypothetical protein